MVADVKTISRDVKHKNDLTILRERITQHSQSAQTNKWIKTTQTSNHTSPSAASLALRNQERAILALHNKRE